ncbi:hypothetical protein P154DRAFT_592854 [Amniculicola lignicola CBS 123094]|uniref:Fungal N-terminal domain-containing protein n=1 Tax=Amniculicola lignicola CBS 123094 TaxID=1392246 RepID=A0A6A5X3J8_9PLEO|nr:hypothetical protein P154DRAFT_592854 [Amniculicola lignicola CBS 123094]
MADPVSIVASAITVATTAAQLSRCLFEFADAIKNARDEIADTAMQIYELSGSFMVLSDLLRVYHSLCSSELLQNIHSMLSRFGDIEKQIKDLTNRDKKLKTLRWFFRGPKARELLKKVESIKTGLLVVLNIMRFAADQAYAMHVYHPTIVNQNGQQSPRPLPNRLRTIVENSIQASYFTVKRAAEIEPVEAGLQWDGTIQRWQADSHDTATWLYQLVFSQNNMRGDQSEGLEPPYQATVKGEEVKAVEEHGSSDSNVSNRATHGTSPRNAVVRFDWGKKTEPTYIVNKLFSSWISIPQQVLDVNKALPTSVGTGEWEKEFLKKVKEIGPTDDVDSDGDDNLSHTNIDAFRPESPRPAQPKTNHNAQSKKRTDANIWNIKPDPPASSDEEYESAPGNTGIVDSPKPPPRSHTNKFGDFNEDGYWNGGNTSREGLSKNRNNREDRQHPAASAYQCRRNPPQTWAPDQRFGPFPPPNGAGLHNDPPFGGSHDSYQPHQTVHFMPPSTPRSQPPPPRKPCKSSRKKRDKIRAKIEEPLEFCAEQTQNNEPPPSKVDELIDLGNGLATKTESHQPKTDKPGLQASELERKERILRLESLLLEEREESRLRHIKSEEAWRAEMAEREASAAKRAEESRILAEKEIAAAQEAKDAADATLQYMKDEAAARARAEAEAKAAEERRKIDEEYRQRMHIYEEKLEAFTRKQSDTSDENRTQSSAPLPLRVTCITDSECRIEVSEFTEHLGGTMAHLPMTFLQNSFAATQSMASSYQPSLPSNFNRHWSNPKYPGLPVSSVVPRTENSEILLPAHLDRTSMRTSELQVSLSRAGMSSSFDRSEAQSLHLQSRQTPLQSVRSTIFWEPPLLSLGSYGQTYFLGDVPVHVHFFAPNYTPQLEASRTYTASEHVITATEIIDELAIRELGF